jgi:hypothetical protein
MNSLLLPLLTMLAGLLRSRAVLHMEILALRQPLAGVTARGRKRLRFGQRERFFWICVYRVLLSAESRSRVHSCGSEATVVVQPTEHRAQDHSQALPNPVTLPVVKNATLQVLAKVTRDEHRYRLIPRLTG